ncbi:diacylglycerol kinase (ATP) [Compostimonas suwonensis]|uniref:Diacylglycerol kinase (ATP) n=1 Tax=Compostimonas suwonensis TaxID=1048394 RepID=A0A2M9C065_9MICO|nr:diacylglycerol kinase (ATP) [Compostimonas suwonensis]
MAVNPRAAFGRHRDVGPRVVAALRGGGYGVTALLEPDYATLRSAAASALARPDGGCADALVVVGGDGMVSLGANLVAQTGIPLGIVPSGTGNDMARGLGIPLDDTDAAIAVLTRALGCGIPGSPVVVPGPIITRTIDAGRVHHADGTTWFASVVSAGFDARVNERANGMRRPRGASRYTIAMVRELIGLRAIRYSLVVDGQARELDALLISVANNGSIGGGMRIAPDARLDDGALDLFVVAPLSRIGLMRVFPRVFRGTHTSLPQVSLERVRSVALDAPGVVAYADGERIGPLPVTIEVVAGALRVLA